VRVVILRHTYTRNRDTARAGLRYYQMRPRGEGEPPRSLFTKDGTVSRAEAYHLLDVHQARCYLAPGQSHLNFGRLSPMFLRNMTCSTVISRSTLLRLAPRSGNFVGAGR